MEVFSVERLAQKVLKSLVKAGQMPPSAMSSDVVMENVRETVKEYIKKDKEQFRFRDIWLI